MESREHQQGACRSVPAVEVQSAHGVRVVYRTAPQGEGTVIADGARRPANPVVVLPVRIGEIRARPAQLFLDLGLGIPELAGELVVGELDQMRMRERVRADVDASVDMIAKVGPGHRRKFLRVVALELWYRQGGARASERRTDEDLDRDSETLECRKHGRGTAKSIVERHTDATHAPEQTDLAQEQIGRDREPVFPRRGDSVIAEDERRHEQLAPDEPADEEADPERACEEQPAEQDCRSRDA
jgi:hypothetical protein